MNNLLLAALFLAAPAAAAVKTGQPAPDFTLTDTQGKSRSLKEFAGKTVVLEWTNADCPFVKKHYDSDNMQTLQKDYTAKGVVWLTMNSSANGKQGHVTAAQQQEMAKKNGWAGTAYLLDGDGKVGKLYDAKTTPHMYVIDPKGTLIYAGAIDDNPSPNPAVIPNSKNFVRVALDAQMAGKPIQRAQTKPYGCAVKYKS